MGLALDPYAVARATGGNVIGRWHVLSPAPGHSARDRSLSIRLDPSAPDGFILHPHAGDDWRACRDHVKAALALPETHRERRQAPRRMPSSADADRIKAALRIWAESRDPRGTVTERYLASRDLTPASNAIRHHSALRYDGTRTPGMVALMRDALTDVPCGVHRTFLDSDGRKLDRRMLGRAKGACVKVSPDEDVTLGLTLCEGVEDALSLTKSGIAPVWAALSAGAIAAFPVLSGLECLTVVADADEAGRSAAASCAERWHQAGAEVRVLTMEGAA